MRGRRAGLVSSGRRATEGYKLQLHSECDFLLSRFKIRRELRAGEIDALKR